MGHGGTRGAVCCLALAISALLGSAAGAQTTTAPVSADYFGSSFQVGASLPPQLRNRHLERMRSLGIREARVVFPWRMIEPRPPGSSGPAYDFARTDEIVAAAARNGVRLQINLVQAPNWASGVRPLRRLLCGLAPGIHSLAPARGHAPTFAAMAAAVAARYGTNGDLWRAQLPSRPVRVYEIWNEPQLVGAWCPGPQPEIYARYFVAGATAIKAADPGAQVVTGGIGHVAANRNPPSFLPPELFLSRAIAAQPRLLELADAVSVHAYPGPSRSQQLERVASLRGALRAGGVPDSMPMRIGEIGWHTRDSRSAISEAERAEAYRTLTRVLPRTNCNVSAILQHAWVSHQVGGRRDTWFGIVRPRTTVPYESAVAYAKGIALMTGRTDQPPPTGTIDCLP